MVKIAWERDDCLFISVLAVTRSREPRRRWLQRRDGNVVKKQRVRLPHNILDVCNVDLDHTGNVDADGPIIASFVQNLDLRHRLTWGATRITQLRQHMSISNVLCRWFFLKIILLAQESQTCWKDRRNHHDKAPWMKLQRWTLEQKHPKICKTTKWNSEIQKSRHCYLLFGLALQPLNLGE